MAMYPLPSPLIVLYIPPFVRHYSLVSSLLVAHEISKEENVILFNFQK
jgi:hypothetical protein